MFYSLTKEKKKKKKSCIHEEKLVLLPFSKICVFNIHTHLFLLCGIIISYHVSQNNKDARNLRNNDVRTSSTLSLGVRAKIMEVN